MDGIIPGHYQLQLMKPHKILERKLLDMFTVFTWNFLLSLAGPYLSNYSIARL